mmetsp:Transcript_20360/g.59044  ORF Transcript_20360/g.59044 Transcript_20360/m.59044 type:complete len:240 (+) Transcript_20360:627-1346(+)
MRWTTGTRFPMGIENICAMPVLTQPVSVSCELPPPAEIVPQKQHRRTTAWSEASRCTAAANSPISKVLLPSASARWRAACASPSRTPMAFSFARMQCISTPVSSAGRPLCGSPSTARRSRKAFSTIQFSRSCTSTSMFACPMSHSTARSSNWASSSPDGTKILMITCRPSSSDILCSTLSIKRNIPSRLSWSDSSMSRWRPVVPPAITSRLFPESRFIWNSRRSTALKSSTRSLRTNAS